jgi:hypothetical protein
VRFDLRGFPTGSRGAGWSSTWILTANGRQISDVVKTAGTGKYEDSNESRLVQAGLKSGDLLRFRVRWSLWQQTAETFGGTREGLANVQHPPEIVP